MFLPFALPATLTRDGGRGRGVVRDEGKKESEYGEESKKVMKAKEIGRR